MELWNFLVDGRERSSGALLLPRELLATNGCWVRKNHPLPWSWQDVHAPVKFSTPFLMQEALGILSGSKHTHAHTQRTKWEVGGISVGRGVARPWECIRGRVCQNMFQERVIWGEFWVLVKRLQGSKTRAIWLQFFQKHRIVLWMYMDSLAPSRCSK